jgi:hypothetical protein
LRTVLAQGTAIWWNGTSNGLGLRATIPMSVCLYESIGIRQEPRMSTTFDPRFLEDLAKKLAASVPAQLTALKDDLDNNFKSVLQAGLGKLDLVTRQEFDVQAGVLARTREMLAKLEARLAELERKP